MQNMQNMQMCWCFKREASFHFMLFYLCPLPPQKNMFSCLVIFFSLAKESKKVVEVRWSPARNSAHNPKWIKYVRRQNICKRFILEMESVFTLFTLPPPQFANYYSLLQRKISIVVLVWPRPRLLPAISPQRFLFHQLHVWFVMKSSNLCCPLKCFPCGELQCFDVVLLVNILLLYQL